MVTGPVRQMLAGMSRAPGGDDDFRYYNRDKLAQRFNAQTKEITGGKPFIYRKRTADSLPVMMTI